MRKLLNEISISEMMEMRNSGMTNQEIASSLDVTYATVIRHIGKQPKNLRRKPEPSAPVTQMATPYFNDAEKSAEHDDDEIILLSDEKITKLCGAVGYYTISDKEKTVRISINTGGAEIEVPFEKFADFHAEILRIMKNSTRFIGREGY